MDFEEVFGMSLYDNDSYREEFMEEVYKLLADDPDNSRANEIIDLFDNAPEFNPPNEPLTLEQLREMDGEPVWCKWLLPEDKAIEQGKWFIVISGDKAGLEIKRPAEYGYHFCKIDDYGKTWLAYRRPPEGDEDK